MSIGSFLIKSRLNKSRTNKKEAMTKTEIIIKPAAAKQPFLFFFTVFHPQCLQQYDFFIMTQNVYQTK
ncbi:hypothetical protein PT2222_140312 [Paraburkholderia tropica]